jgi:hypothetical protein
MPAFKVNRAEGISPTLASAGYGEAAAWSARSARASSGGQQKFVLKKLRNFGAGSNG